LRNGGFYVVQQFVVSSSVKLDLYFMALGPPSAKKFGKFAAGLKPGYARQHSMPAIKSAESVTSLTSIGTKSTSSGFI
jgi:hypothetical protein